MCAAHKITVKIRSRYPAKAISFMTLTVRGKMSAVEVRGAESTSSSAESSSMLSTMAMYIFYLLIFALCCWGAYSLGIVIRDKVVPAPNPTVVAANAAAASAAALNAKNEEAKKLTTCASCTEKYIWCANTQKCSAYTTGCMTGCEISSTLDCGGPRETTCKAGVAGLSEQLKGSQNREALNSLAAGLDTLLLNKLTQLTQAETARQGSGSRPRSEGFQNQSLPLSEILFLNTQYLAIKDTGFLGPYPSGSFNEESATINALKAGFRFLTLEIDYMDTKKNLINYEAPREPTLLIRNGSSITSSNSGSIKKVADTIANYAFSPQVPSYTYPVIIYLHFIRTPSALKEPEEYLSFMSKVATQIGSLAPQHLGLTPQGNYTRQNLPGQLLTMPLVSLNGTFIILSNADTTLFRNQKMTSNKYKPAEDLDFWVNMRVFLDDENDTNGITQLSATGESPHAVLVSLPRILSLSSSKKESFAATGKKRFVIAMGPRTTNPTPSEMNIALNTLGVNAIPIDIFTPSIKETALLLNEHSDMAFRKKPFSLQYTS
jgi:hypothetical protein